MKAQEIIVNAQGLDVPYRFPYPDHGLLLVTGPNNAGKSLFLKAVQSSRSLRRVRGIWKLVPPKDDPDHAIVPHAFHDVQVTWDSQGRGVEYHPQLSDVIHRGESILKTYLEKSIRTRKRVAVPTNRHFFGDCEGNPASGVPREVEDPSVWPVQLHRLKISTEPNLRDRWERVARAFEEVTDGLTILPKGNYDTNRITLHVIDGQTDLPIDRCGDGLRDLIGIILYCETYSDAELFIDDPGLRLHPSSQRRLLNYLVGQARDRPIWMASHEITIVGSHSIARRFAVSRNRESATTSVQELPSRSELAGALTALGWQPQDALLADTVLLAEGPSDVVAFGTIIDLLTQKDPTRSGTLVAELGGIGVAKSPQQLGRQLETLRRVAPHVKVAVLLDKDEITKAEEQKMTREYDRLDVPLSFLKRKDLEDYWRSAEILQAIFEIHAGNSKVDIAPPSGEELRVKLNELRQKHAATPPSKLLRKLLYENWRLQLCKPAAARAAMTVYAGDRTQKDCLELEEEVISALLGARRLRSKPGQGPSGPSLGR